MNCRVSTLACAAALMALAGCVDNTGSGSPIGNSDTPARQACLRDVARTTGNSNVGVISSSFSEAGTEVIVRVGPTGRWRCIAYRDGSTAGIQSITDEGAL